ncbi:aminodeoxychorismate synthase component I [Virgibacillus pantothenticus]|uniref:aminodeoxychorismate synthase component I n=1 Tax=Virgibacillus TaxID=84406 RepID=UPI00090B79D8|nr:MULTISPECIES: aminodeoxychorismate synthase component I [Virgibacillus]API93649.1 aminodeoxychorismate synthase, component I [Virgibacillus sp. 6R]MBS7429957.1 aminodeoxychorismate synthase component I [Virgibacillus sp. 19R1-5]MBU8564945.1 aminodeoxychorismate synthase component I [Virgibacillus pantothenticus]MBU8599253.1 aminodeoxychorismate synthase component I [Virgibacillus pantothenticus]MBU8633344.1 aminodeoxychorismate synthase component I [Virgibacillus pantothenticus]
MKQHNPYLRFDFSNTNPISFTDPITIISTYEQSEVIPCLQAIEQYIQAGYYAAGFLAYEAAPAFDRAFEVHNSDQFPLLWFGIFSEAKPAQKWKARPFTIDEWKLPITASAYKKNINQIKYHIENGDTYQVNYTVPMFSRFAGDTFGYYQRLTASQAANYCAYLHIGSHSILSASPELFFHLQAGLITTKPMKGTAKRGNTLEEDKAIAEWLYQSEKNRAENVMIVDLLRNDLGTIAKPGTVHVPQLFTIERYPTVFQMTSTVTAEVEPDITAIFKALFPCGSITGAPKVNTMKIIHEVETAPRNIYCGAIGYMTPQKEAIFNVPIRTVLIDNVSGEATYGVGGGITWDSTSEEEYEEMLSKTLVLKKQMNDFELLESIRLENGKFSLLDYHLKRMAKSAAFFSYPFEVTKMELKLEQIATQWNTGTYKLRVLLANTGEITSDVQPIKTNLQTLKVKLAQQAIDKSNPFYYHKTTNREMYHTFLQDHPDADDVLLWNAELEVTEFTIGNVVVEMNGAFYTPPVHCGLLPGTFRQHAIEKGMISEKIITIKDLESCSRIWLINSVRGWVPVTLDS